MIAKAILITSLSLAMIYALRLSARTMTKEMLGPFDRE